MEMLFDSHNPKREQDSGNISNIHSVIKTEYCILNTEATLNVASIPVEIVINWHFDI